MDIRQASPWIWALVMLVILAAIGVLVLDEINNSGAWNSENSTGAAVIGNSTLSIANVTKQLPTVGIIVGVMLIIGAVVLMAVYFGKRGGYM